jgi:hypothetical protein
MPESPPPAPARRGRSGPRIAAVVAGGVAGVLALLTIAAGGALLWGDSRKDHDGYLWTGTDRFHTRTAAITTDNLDIDTGGASDLLGHGLFGTVRVRAESHAGKPVFVGIARTEDVDRYLRGTDHATVTDVDTSPFKATYRTSAATRRPAAPAEQSFWATSAGGTGEQQVTWKVKDGDWSVVVMNADASRRVDAGVRAGADLPWLDEAAWVTLGIGALIALAAAGLIVAGTRAPRDGGARHERDDDDRDLAATAV